VSKYFSWNKKTIGIRVPDNVIAQQIVKEIGVPLLVTTIHHDDEVLAYMTDPLEIEEKFSNQVDLVIDGGIGGNAPSTIVDCSNGEVEILRNGKSELMQ
jgi:tRNA A37 threonylcarbamoyladenosine synthetase subunit TsaC/SUA5/YrdC